MPPRVQPAPSRLKAAQSAAGSGRFKALYRTRRWQLLRQRVLVEGSFTCVRCGHMSLTDMVCDHRNGHPAGETEDQFWAGPFDVLCANCHNTSKRREDDAVRRS